MKIYNTLTRKVEEFKPLNPPEVGMYSCGPTVYDHTHFGHMRTYVNTDLLRRVLEYNGFNVTQVMNITDVGHLFGDRDMGEDKLETAAQAKKRSAWEIAKDYEKEFFETMTALNVLRPTMVCRATEHIPEMIALLKKIEENGFTYKTSDGIYFNTAEIKDYNLLSGMPLEQLKEGARVEVNPEKKNLTDFALWKFSPKDKKREMEWDSPWGKGFPGWHIECSAMSIKYLGEKFDLHTGGVDHIPVHHTNEIVQNQAATGHQVVNFWFHNEFLLVEGGKMSKSKGNFYTMGDIEKRGFEPLALRYLFLTSHYRQKTNFTWESLEGAKSALGKLREIMSGLQINESSALSSEKLDKIDSFRESFKQAINDDLKIPEALAVVWQMLKSNISSADKRDLIFDFDQILGFNLAKTPVRKTLKIPLKVKKLIEERESLRKENKWDEADKIREEIEKEGFTIGDTDKGPFIKRAV